MKVNVSLDRICHQTTPNYQCAVLSLSLIFFLSRFVLSILYIHVPRVLHLKVDLCVYLYFLVYGKNVAAVVEQPLEEEKMHPGKNTVTFEARELKSLFMRLV